MEENINKSNEKLRADIEKDIVKSLSTVTSSIDKLEHRSSCLEVKTTKHDILIDQMRQEQTELSDKVLKLECRSMRENLIFSGLEESQEEDEDTLRSTLTSLIENKLNVEDASDIDILECHRLPKPRYFKGTDNSRPRNVVAKFANKHHVYRILKHASRILKHASNLKGEDPPIFINQQYPSEIANRRRTLLPVYRMAKAHKMKAFLNQDKLTIRGSIYTVDNISDAPLDTSSLAQKEDASTVAFCGRLSTMSNFHDSPFILNRSLYTCVEQYYQSTKAKVAKNDRAAMEIMMASDPAVMKRIGDQVKVKDDWSSQRETVMLDALLAKFGQIRELRNELLAHGDKVLAEASSNRFWGCGMSLKDPNILATESWTGKNTLGTLLDKVRSQVKNIEDPI